MNWFGRLTRGGRMEGELDRELRFHFESQVADKVEAGMSEAEARRTTRLEFGGVDQIKEDCRESRGTLWLASIAQDLRSGMRILVRSPGFSVTAILVLALGIGVSTLAFSLYNLIALQSIPVRESATLVKIERRSPENIAPGVPYASIAYYREHAKSLSAVMAAMSATPMAMNHEEQRVRASFVTANYFAELGCLIRGVKTLRARLRWLCLVFGCGRGSLTAMARSLARPFILAGSRRRWLVWLRRALHIPGRKTPMFGFRLSSIRTSLRAVRRSTIQRSME
jgi:hypothetical protein